jgi:hypothetical protein
MLADVRLTGAALQAFAAGHVHFGGDEVTLLHAGDLVADGFDDAAEFVSRNQWRMNTPLRPLVPIVDMEIGAADGSDLDFNQYVGSANLGLGDFANFALPGADVGFTTASIVFDMRALATL